MINRINKTTINAKPEEPDDPTTVILSAHLKHLLFHVSYADFKLFGRQMNGNHFCFYFVYVIVTTATQRS